MGESIDNQLSATEAEKSNRVRQILSSLKSSPKQVTVGLAALTAIAAVGYGGVQYLVRKKLPPLIETQISNHINGCKTDANACNLEWVNASENMSHAHSNGLRPKINTQGENNGFAKLTEAQVRQIKQLLANRQLTQKAIGSQYDVSRSTVKDIKSGRLWRHVA